MDPEHRPAGPRLGLLLVAARQARGWTQTEMAERLRAMSQKLGRGVQTGRDGVCRWEHGRVPDVPTQRLIAEVLGIPSTLVDERQWPQWLSADPAQQVARRPWTPDGAAQSLADLTRGASMDVTRRQLAIISGGALTQTLFGWLTADPAALGQIVSGRRIGEAGVAKLEARAQVLRKTDDEAGGGSVLEESAAALALAHVMITNRSYTAAHGARLHAVASDLARQRAAAAFDTRGTCEDQAFDAALRAARVAGDDALGANVLVFWSSAAYNTGRLHDAEQMADAAVAVVRGKCDPRVEALMLTRRARARAHLGDARCLIDLDRAEELLGRAEEQSTVSPAWAYWFDHAEILGARASSYQDLGRHDLAEAVFAQADAAFGAGTVRTHAVYLCRMAGAQFAQGELEKAAATAGTALDLTQAITSRRTTEPLLDLADKLACHRTAAARDFAERARTLLAA